MAPVTADDMHKAISDPEYRANFHTTSVFPETNWDIQPPAVPCAVGKFFKKLHADAVSANVNIRRNCDSVQFPAGTPKPPKILKNVFT